MSTPMMMTNCPTDQTISDFLDNELDPETRARVVEHIVNCPDCYALVSGGWDYQAMEQKELAPVVKGWFGSWGKWAVAAVAASVVIVLALPITRDSMALRSRRSELIAAQDSAKLRTVVGRLPGFSYLPLKGITRSGNPEDDADDFSKYRIQNAAYEVLERNPHTARQQAVHFTAHLLLNERKEAIEAIERAAASSPNDPLILNGRIVAYLQEVRWTGDAAAAKHALEAAESAWQVAQTPEIAFNRALAFEAVKRRAEAIQAWQGYLALDANSPWATEATQHLQQLQDPDRPL